MSMSRLLSLTAIFSLLLLLACSTSQPLPVNFPQAADGLHYDTPATVWDEAIPLGNGIMGALVWGDGEPLKLSLDRADLWDLRPVPEFHSSEYTFEQMRAWHKQGRVADLKRVYEMWCRLVSAGWSMSTATYPYAARLTLARGRSTQVGSRVESVYQEVSDRVASTGRVNVAAASILGHSDLYPVSRPGPARLLEGQSVYADMVDRTMALVARLPAPDPDSRPVTAAILALMQVNMRRMLAFAVISHTGVIIIGLFSLSHAGFQGSMLLSMTFGTATACLLLMSGFVYRRTRTLLLPRLGGLFGHLPVIGSAFLIAGLSIIGMPGTPGFDAVHLLLEAAILEFGAMVTIAAALGNVAAAAFLLWAFQRTFLAPLAEGMPAPEIEPALPMERIIAVILIMILLGTGFYSEPWLVLLEHSFDGLTALYDGHGHAGALDLVTH